MSSQTYESTEMAATATRTWGGAVVAGLVAGLGMGLIMHFVMDAMPLIGALYGQPTVASGWIAHLFHSVVFALVFAAILGRASFRGTSFREYSVLGVTGLGVIYGLVLEVVAAGIVLPLWANAVGAGPLPVPFLLPIGFLTHLVYGVLLGAAFGVVTSRQRSRSASRGQSERRAA